MTYKEFHFRVWQKFRTMTRACRSIGMNYRHWSAIRANIYYAETPARQRQLDEIWSRMEAADPLYEVTPEMIHHVRYVASKLPGRGRTLAKMAGISETSYYLIVNGSAKYNKKNFTKLWDTVKKIEIDLQHPKK
jgi:hypothetical protein